MHPDEMTDLPMTRKQILEADAEDAIARERRAHVSHPDWTPQPLPEEFRAAVDDAVHRQFQAEAEEFDAKLTAAVSRYLRETHASNWGRSFAIETDAGRQRATDFIMDLLRSVAQTVVTMNEEERASVTEVLKDYEARRVADHDSSATGCSTCMPDDERVPGEKVILVVSTVRRAYAHMAEHGIEPRDVIVISKLSDTERLRSMELHPRQVHYVDNVTDLHLIREEISARYRYAR